MKLTHGHHESHAHAARAAQQEGAVGKAQLAQPPQAGGTTAASVGTTVAERGATAGQLAQAGGGGAVPQEAGDIPAGAKGNRCERMLA